MSLRSSNDGPYATWANLSTENLRTAPEKSEILVKAGHPLAPTNPSANRLMNYWQDELLDALTRISLFDYKDFASFSSKLFTRNCYRDNKKDLLNYLLKWNRRVEEFVIVYKLIRRILLDRFCTRKIVEISENLARYRSENNFVGFVESK